MDNERFGRLQLYTSEPKITRDNIISVVRAAYAQHKTNASRIQALLDYEAGKQEKIRKKTYRPDIDNWCVDNIANEITEFKLGYQWGNPITIIQSDDDDKEDDATLTRGISILNQCYRAENIKSKTQNLARFIEIGAVGYTYVDINTEWVEGDSYFKVDVLDPRCTFVVRSSYYPDRRVMVGVTFWKDKTGFKHFTCFTNDRRYELDTLVEDEKWNHSIRSDEMNPLGRIPIIEWVRSYDRMGCFERQIDEMDNLNLLVSDFTNDVDQNTQAVWHANDVEFPVEITEDENGNKVEEVKKPKSGDWVNTRTPKNGNRPFIEPLTINYDYSGMLNNIVTRRALILQKCNVPQRNDNSGSSTGVAMSDATGWSAAEQSACKQQLITESCKMEEVKVVLAAIQISPFVPADSPLLTLRYWDVQPKITRQKTYELTVKVNAMCALIAKGFALEDVVSNIPLFEDPNQIISRSGYGISKYQEANVFKVATSESVETKAFSDLSDNETQSPSIGGISKQEAVDVDDTGV